MGDLGAQNGACPHWSTQTRNCRVGRGGLYIPTAHHVQLYCRSGNHRLCARYRQALGGCALDGYGLGRRSSPRVPGRFTVRLLSREKDGRIESLEREAHTVDLSREGLRLACDQPLPPGARVAFRFGEDFADDTLAGVAEVRWSAPCGRGYHVGLHFTDAPVTERSRTPSRA